MSFHTKMLEAERLYADVVASHPDLADRAAKLRDHYLNGGLEKPSPTLLQGALCLMTEENFAKAAQVLSQYMRLPIMNTEKHIIDSVNQGPSFLIEDEDCLHAKGVMRGSKKYFLGFKGIEQGGYYDRAWQAMDPAYRPIAAAAVQGAMSQRDKVISKPVLKYVAVCLMPEDNAKDFQLNKLSIDYERGAHMKHLRAAAGFIRRTARNLNIQIPESMMKGALTPKEQRIDGAHIPLPPPIAAPAPSGSVVRRDFGRTPIAGPKTDSLLRDDLKTLINNGAITEKSSNVYFWLYGNHDDQNRTIEDAAERFGKSEKSVRILVAHINLKLRVMRSQEPDSSNGDFHQSRTIRP